MHMVHKAVTQSLHLVLSFSLPATILLYALAFYVSVHFQLFFAMLFLAFLFLLLSAIRKDGFSANIVLSFA
jgi:hypothetical protein